MYNIGTVETLLLIKTCEFNLIQCNFPDFYAEIFFVDVCVKDPLFLCATLKFDVLFQ